MIREKEEKNTSKINLILEYSLPKKIIGNLLKDNTTKKNIIYATDDYSNLDLLGNKIKTKTDEIVSVVNIKPRFQKRIEEQKRRVKDKAEVFTPSWVCNKQNNLCDTAFLGKKNVFNKERKDNTWVSNNAIDVSLEDAKKYISSLRIEITCGEAPYLTSRYDAVNYLYIQCQNRVGMLDRKLKLVSQFFDNEEEWLTYATIAYKSIYGYEFQGDNLFIARRNLLFSFIDFYQEKFKKFPEQKEIEKISKIISWNIFQMNGMTFTIPFSDIEVKIKNWNENKVLKFSDLITEDK